MTGGTGGGPAAQRPLKIALVCDWYLPRFGGLELQLEQLARGLADRGHDVHIVTGVPNDTPATDPPDGPRVVRLAAPVFPGHGFIFTPGAFWGLRRVLRDGGFDVVHCHFSYVAPMAFAGALFAQRLGLPTLVSFHSFLGNFRSVLAILNVVFRWSRWPVVFTAVSQVIAEQMRPLMAVDIIRRLPNGVTRNDWAPAPLAGDREAVTLVTVMRLKVRKRPRALLRIVASARRRLNGVPFTMVVIGDGPERAKTERLARRLGLEDAVEFMGFQSPEVIRQVFARSDVFVLPTVLESFGIAALEARYSGLPVVARRQSGVCEFIAHEREGLLADSDDEMADQIARLVRDDALRRAIAERNRRDDTAEYDWPVVLDRTVELYAEAATVQAAAARPRR